jgi:DNA-damage-inducible protein D
MENNLIIFKGKNIRRTLHNNEWYFSVVDVVEVLTESTIAKRYWTDLKKKLIQDEGFDQLYEKIVQLKLEASDGKKYKTDCANTETLFRIIQSIPSPKAEPFKKWLAKVGYERIQEIENPELAQQRMKSLYKAKGYPDAWIEKRLRGIAVRDVLTDEWSRRGVEEGREYAILTAEISQATFGMTPSEYKEFKSLKRENLRDHMTDLELIFTMLGEASTTEIARNTDAQGFDENRTAAKKGGRIAGDARKQLEIEGGKPVVSPDNYLQLESQEVRQVESKKCN